MASNIDRHYIRIVLDGRRIENEDGGKGSGNFGHKGRPGLRGGSGKGGGKIYRTAEEGSASGYVGIQRAKAFKGITEVAKKSRDANSFVDSLSDSQWKLVTDQRKACGTQEDNLTYAERLYKMLITTSADLPYQKPRVVQGKDISNTWKRQPNKFEHEINDVIHAQGFDGVPRIVSKAEFDKAVKEANGGKGFIAQRTYSATTPEELKGFRDQLYRGEWYVACTTGGAQYGQGMYCAADYKGELSDGIKTEMIHYIAQYESLGSFKTTEEWAEEATKSAVSVLSMSIKPEVREWIPQHPDLVRQWAEAYYEGNGAKAKPLTAVIPEEVRESLVNFFPTVQRLKKQPHNVETFTLTPDAKIITFNEIYRLRERVGVLNGIAEMEKTGKYSKEDLRLMKRYANLDPDDIDYQKKAWAIGEKLSREAYNDSDDYFRAAKRNLPSDNGVFAAMMGYDAINAEGHGQSDSYTVVLNRTKCIFLDPDDPAGEEYWGYSKVS